MTATALLTRRDDLHETTWAETAVPEPGPGQVVVAVEAVACTANTFTYGVMGERLRYWDVYPTGRDGWGALPAWGYGHVVAGDGLDEGSRLFGLLPIASHAVLTPTKVRATSWRDGSPHRAELPLAYQFYERLAAEPEPGEELRALLHPLFVLGFLLAGALKEARPGTVLITSASSKTAQAIAQQLAGSGNRVVGLSGHPEACAAAGVFDEVRSYAEAPGMRGDVLVDVAGDPRLRAQLHAGRTVLVGATRRDAGALAGDGAFSAVDQLRSLARTLGADELARRQEAAWEEYVERLGPQVEVVRSLGRDDVEQAYREVLDGRCPPRHGHLLTVGHAVDHGPQTG